MKKLFIKMMIFVYVFSSFVLPVCTICSAQGSYPSHKTPSQRINPSSMNMQKVGLPSQGMFQADLKALAEEDCEQAIDRLASRGEMVVRFVIKPLTSPDTSFTKKVNAAAVLARANISSPKTLSRVKGALRFALEHLVKGKSPQALKTKNAIITALKQVGSGKARTLLAK